MPATTESIAGETPTSRIIPFSFFFLRARFLRRTSVANHDSPPPYRPLQLGTSEHHGSPTPGLRNPYHLRCALGLSFFFLRENHWKLRPQLTTSVSPESGPDRCDQYYHCSIVGVKSFLCSKLQPAAGDVFLFILWFLCFDVGLR